MPPIAPGRHYSWVTNSQGGHVHMPALGSAAATLVASLIYLIWPSANGTPPQAARADAAAMQAEWTPVSLGRTRSRAESAGGSARSSQDADYAVLCEVPLGHATVHWMEYLEFRRMARAQAQSRKGIEK